MAYYTNLVALSSDGDKYVVESSITASVNVRLIMEDKLLNDVSDNNFYLDQAGIFQKDKFLKYLDADSKNSAGQKWYKQLSKNVKLIIVHKLEWESGLGH